jgi:hypothetical protein
MAAPAVRLQLYGDVTLPCHYRPAAVCGRIPAVLRTIMPAGRAVVISRHASRATAVPAGSPA